MRLKDPLACLEGWCGDGGLAPVRPLASTGDGGEGFYILSNDAVRTPVAPASDGQASTLIGIGNPHLLHAIALASAAGPLERIIALDSNPRQLAHLAFLLRLVQGSPDRLAFVSRLFCGQFSPSAALHLTGSPASRRWAIGGCEEGPSDPSRHERSAWEGFRFDPDAFREAYGRSAEVVDGGLMVTQDVIGGIGTCRLSLFPSMGGRGGPWVFTAGWGTGHLRSEEDFSRLRTILGKVPVTLVHADAGETIPDLCRHFRYRPLVIWTSNLFCPWFMDRHKPLRDLHSWCLANGCRRGRLPEYDLRILQDERKTLRLPRRVRADAQTRVGRLTPHTRTFRAVSGLLPPSEGIEVVTMPSWIAEDGGQSKLPLGRYLLAAHLTGPLDRHMPWIFAHHLGAHGASVADLRRWLPWLRASAQRFIITDSLPGSWDHPFRRDLIGPEVVQSILGPEVSFSTVSGRFGKPRNYLMIYGS